MKQIHRIVPGKIVLMILVFFSFATNVLAQKKGEYYQLTVYHYKTEAQEKQLDAYLQQALLPALHRLKINQVGVFKAIANDTAAIKKIYVFAAGASAATAAKDTQTSAIESAQATGLNLLIFICILLFTPNSQC